jgi:hypothetical protein
MGHGLDSSGPMGRQSVHHRTLRAFFDKVEPIRARFSLILRMILSENVQLFGITLYGFFEAAAKYSLISTWLILTFEPGKDGASS